MATTTKLVIKVSINMYCYIYLFNDYIVYAHGRYRWLDFLQKNPQKPNAKFVEFGDSNHVEL